MSRDYSTLVLAATANLLGYWRLGDASGTTAVDALGFYNGTYSATGITLGQAGAITLDSNTAVAFDGSTGKITTALNPFINGTVRTYEGWAIRTNSAGTYTLISSDAVTSIQPLLRIAANNPGDMVWFPRSSASVSWTAAVPSGSWFHWVLIFDESADTAELYINGVSKGVKTALTDQYSATPGNLQIGMRGTSTTPFLGSMDEVAVYSRALTASEIIQHYAMGLKRRIALVGSTLKAVPTLNSSGVEKPVLA